MPRRWRRVACRTSSARKSRFSLAELAEDAAEHVERRPRPGRRRARSARRARGPGLGDLVGDRHCFGSASDRHRRRRAGRPRAPRAAGRSTSRPAASPRPGRSRRPGRGWRCSGCSRSGRRPRRPPGSPPRGRPSSRSSSGGRGARADRASRARISNACPYGWLSTRCRRSFLTTSRWLSSFSWRQGRQQEAHPVGLEPERQLQARCSARSRSSSSGRCSSAVDLGAERLERARSIRSRGAASPGTSGARTGGRTPSAPASRPSSRPCTRG